MINDYHIDLMNDSQYRKFMWRKRLIWIRLIACVGVGGLIVYGIIGALCL